MTIRPSSEIQEAMRRQEKMRALAEELRAVERERQSGSKDYTLEEVSAFLDEVIAEVAGARK